MRLKYICISAINWNASFKDVKGGYYDHVCTMYSPSEAVHSEIEWELVRKGWNRVAVSDTSLAVFEQDRHIIRINKNW